MDQKSYFKTATAWILLANLTVFVLMAVQGGFWSPDPELLIQMGAKDNVRIAAGDLWRLFTPIFVHVGFLHFAVNTVGLIFFGFAIERCIGWRWFFGLYLFGGFCGNLFSALLALELSAGASGSLFALLGCGFILERSVQRKILQDTGTKIKTNALGMLILANILLGFIIPGIDNAAHLGGLLGGLVFTSTMLIVRPNSLTDTNHALGKRTTIIVTSTLCFMMLIASSPALLFKRLVFSAKKQQVICQKTSDQKPAKACFRSVYFFSEATKIREDDLDLHMDLGRGLYLVGADAQAIQTLRLPAKNKLYHAKLENLRTELQNEGINTWELDSLISLSLNSH